jgi:hypothetical protein
MDDVAVPSAAVSKVDLDHYALIVQMVAIVSEDRAQLRQMVYELARRKLRRDLYPQFEEGIWASIRTQMELLDAAIHQVESDCAQKSLTFAADPPLAYRAPTDDFGGAQSHLASKHFALATPVRRQHNAGYFLPPQNAIAERCAVAAISTDIGGSAGNSDLCGYRWAVIVGSVADRFGDASIRQASGA